MCPLGATDPKINHLDVDGWNCIKSGTWVERGFQTMHTKPWMEVRYLPQPQNTQASSSDLSSPAGQAEIKEVTVF